MRKNLVTLITLSVTIMLTAGQLGWAVAPTPDNPPLTPPATAIKKEFGAEIKNLQPGDTLAITDDKGKEVGTVVKDQSGAISITISITNSNSQSQKTEVRADQPKPKLKATVRHRTPRHSQKASEKPKPAPKPAVSKTPAAKPPTNAAPPRKENTVETLYFGIPAWIWALVAIVVIGLVWNALNPRPTNPPTPAPAPRGPGAGNAAYRGSGTSTPLGIDLNHAEETPLNVDDVLEKDYEYTSYTTPTSHYRRLRRNKVVERFPDARPGHAYAEVRIPEIELGVVCRERHENTGPTRLTVEEVERLMVPRTDRGGAGGGVGDRGAGRSAGDRDREAGGADRGRDADRSAGRGAGAGRDAGAADRGGAGGGDRGAGGAGRDAGEHGRGAGRGAGRDAGAAEVVAP